MPSINYDLGYLLAALASLDSYLLSDEIYWNLREPSPPGEPAYPQLTLGGILLARARLESRNLSDEQSSILVQLINKLEATRTRWWVAWTRKAAREFGARLRLWRDFIDEYRQNPDANIDRYTYEVSRRVMLQLLLAEAGQISEPEREMLASLDSILTAVLVPGSFIWDPELQNSFPPQKFFYLYGLLRS